MAKILVVDDDSDVVDACRLVLEANGHEVVTAFNRSEGMKALQENNPDLLVLDVIMEQPDDGIRMAQDVRRDGVKIPIIMLTSLSKVVGMEYGKDEDLLPVNEFFEKPIEPTKLVSKVNELLGN